MSPDGRSYLANVKLIRGRIWAFFAAALLLGIGRQMFLVLRNQYLVDLGLPPEEITSVQGFNSVGGLLIAIPAIAIIGRVRAKTLLAVVAIVNAAGFAAQGVFGGLDIFRVAAFFAGVAMSLNIAMVAPFLMRNTSPAERVFAFSFQTAVAWPLSGVIGSLLAGSAQQWGAAAAADGLVWMGQAADPRMFGYQVALIAAAVIVLTALVPALLMREERPETADLSVRQLLKVHDRRRLFLLGLPEMFIGFGAGLTVPFFNMYFQTQWLLNPVEVSYVFTAMFAMLVLSYLAAPVLVRRFGPVKVLIVAQLLSLPFFVELAMRNAVWLAVIAFIMRNNLMNLCEPIYKQFAQETADPRDRNAVAVAVHSSRHLFFTIANFVSGYLIAAASGEFTLVIAATIVCYIAAIVVEMLIMPRLDRLRREQARGESVPAAPAALT